MNTLNQRNSRALGYDYPAGAEFDLSAPYNETDPEVCPDCDGEGCKFCDHNGSILSPSREEIAIDKADAAMDREKDERA